MEAAGDHEEGRATTQRANEDYYRYDDHLGALAVADGVSNRPAARIAAETAIEALFDYITDPNMTSPADARERVERAFAHVHRRVREQAAADEALRGMATTLACVLERRRTLLVGHVGDSRVIRFREGRLERLTADQPVETCALGLGDSTKVDVCVEGLRPHDGVLVTTRGLTAALDDATIVAALQDRDPRESVNELIRCALARGASENVTCVYGRWRPILL
jgi:protein phosphatase